MDYCVTFTVVRNVQANNPDNAVKIATKELEDANDLEVLGDLVDDPTVEVFMEVFTVAVRHDTKTSSFAFTSIDQIASVVEDIAKGHPYGPWSNWRHRLENGERNEVNLVFPHAWVGIAKHVFRREC